MKVTMYSKDSCPFCVLATRLLEKHKIEYEEKKLDKDFNRDEILSQFPNARTFPIIEVDNKWIGGYNELYDLLVAV